MKRKREYFSHINDFKGGTRKEHSIHFWIKEDERADWTMQSGVRPLEGAWTQETSTDGCPARGRKDQGVWWEQCMSVIR